MAVSFENVYLIFDALDESPYRREFLTILEQIRRWGLGIFHLLATSRKEQDIANLLNTLFSHEVSMDASLVDSDIRVHVSKTLERDHDFQSHSAEERKLIETTFTEGAHGM